MRKELVLASVVLSLVGLGNARGAEELLTFEGGRASFDGSVVLSNGYGGLQWSGLNVGSASPMSPGEQFRRGTVSGTNVVISYGDSFVISSGRPFDLRSAWFTTGYSNAPAVRVIGLVGTNKVLTNIFRPALTPTDRKSTRLNSSHSQISYAVFCL